MNSNCLSLVALERLIGSAGESPSAEMRFNQVLVPQEESKNATKLTDVPSDPDVLEGIRACLHEGHHPPNVIHEIQLTVQHLEVDAVRKVQ